MNKAQANKVVGDTRVSRRAARKPIAISDKEKENKENEEKKLNVKGCEGTMSENQVCTRKRRAFGDITNAIQTHANRIALARRKKVTEKQIPAQKPCKATLCTKKTSNKLKGGKSSSSLAVFATCIENDFKEEMSIEEQSHDILQYHASTSSEENEEKDIVQMRPDGVDPFDLDVEDPNNVCEYAHSIFKNMRRREVLFAVTDYLSCEGRLTNGWMRAILVDWLVEVQENFQLYHETLYVAVKLMDVYLQNNDTPKEKLQLVGATALFIACKVEERQPPPLDDFQYICDDTYTKKMFIDMEIQMFKALNFDINIPISYRYLRRFSLVTSMGMEVLTLARFILELSLHAPMFVHQQSSMMAAACLCLAMKMMNAGVWDINHCYHSGYQEIEIKEIMKQLNQMLIESPDSKLKTVQTKYSHSIHYSVAKIKPLPSSTFLS